jgi:glucokinase
MTVLAADLGGRRIKLGVVRAGCVPAMEILPADSDRPLRERLRTVAEALRRLCASVGLAPKDCQGVGISYPSIVDTAQSRILDQFAKYGDASDFDLSGWARAEFGLPLAIDNDARMALIGEWRHGAGVGCDQLAMITLGTGIGTAAIMDGRVLRGRHNQAGILGGHLTVKAGGRPCVCGNLGCAEAEASTWALEHICGPEAHTLREGRQLDYAQIFRLASEGRSEAIKIRDSSLAIWAATAVNLIHAYDPERVILGGGIMGSGQIILPYIRDYVARHAHTPWGMVTVTPSQLGDQAALVACEWLVAERLEITK